MKNKVIITVCITVVFASLGYSVYHSKHVNKTITAAATSDAVDKKAVTASPAVKKSNDATSKTVASKDEAKAVASQASLVKHPTDKMTVTTASSAVNK